MPRRLCSSETTYRCGARAQLSIPRMQHVTGTSVHAIYRSSTCSFRLVPEGLRIRQNGARTNGILVVIVLLPVSDLPTRNQCLQP
jgi:hypothetical protein